MDSQGLKKKGVTDVHNFFPDDDDDAIRLLFVSHFWKEKKKVALFVSGSFKRRNIEEVPTIAEECVSLPSQPKPNQHTHTHRETDIHVACHSISIHTPALSLLPARLSNKPSFSSSGIRITGGINRISLGDASCTHNTTSFLSLLSSLLCMVYVYGIVWLVIVHLREEKKTHFLIDRDNTPGPSLLPLFHFFLNLYSSKHLFKMLPWVSDSARFLSAFLFRFYSFWFF